MDDAMHLLSLSLMEPEAPLFLYSPSWLNVWEAHSYDIALKNTDTNSWAFKRFGTRADAYDKEVVNRTNYMAYICVRKSIRCRNAGVASEGTYAIDEITNCFYLC